MSTVSTVSTVSGVGVRPQCEDVHVSNVKFEGKGGRPQCEDVHMSVYMFRRFAPHTEI